MRRTFDLCDFHFQFLQLTSDTPSICGQKNIRTVSLSGCFRLAIQERLELIQAPYFKVRVNGGGIGEP